MIKRPVTNQIIVIIGPTATGKTKLAIDLAKKFNGEIINADAFQIYQELNIGVNKPTAAELAQAHFHLINNISIHDEWSIKDFQTRANVIINDLITKGKLPIIVGGSHLYIDALIKNYDLTLSTKRANDFDDWSNQKLFDNLFKINPILANKITINNHKRLVRALQVLSVQDKMDKVNKPIYLPLYICCNLSRDILYKKINERTDQMMKQGWINEVKQLITHDKTTVNLNGLKAIGYVQIIDSLINHAPVNVDLIKQKTRNYAKRQVTWINHHYDHYLTYDQSNIAYIYDEVNKWLIKR